MNNLHLLCPMKALFAGMLVMTFLSGCLSYPGGDDGPTIALPVDPVWENLTLNHTASGSFAYRAVFQVATPGTECMITGRGGGPQTDAPYNQFMYIENGTKFKGAMLGTGRAYSYSINPGNGLGTIDDRSDADEWWFEMSSTSRFGELPVAVTVYFFDAAPNVAESGFAGQLAVRCEAPFQVLETMYAPTAAILGLAAAHSTSFEGPAGLAVVPARQHDSHVAGDALYVHAYARNIRGAVQFAANGLDETWTLQGNPSFRHYSGDTGNMQVGMSELVRLDDGPLAIAYAGFSPVKTSTLASM